MLASQKWGDEGIAGMAELVARCAKAPATKVDPLNWLRVSFRGLREIARYRNGKNKRYGSCFARGAKRSGKTMKDTSLNHRHSPVSCPKSDALR